MTAKTSLSTPNKIAIALVVAATLAALAATVFINRTNAASQATAAEAAEVVREDSHRLSTAKDEKAVLVEFLDFECESCLAAYPFIEELRAKHADNLTVVSRYFPLPGHSNALTAAVAVEAAAQQGKFEDMYHRMYETQTEWSHTPESRAGTFRGYAKDLGLDMAAYDAAVADPATTARVETDKNDGLGLGVSGTPTFFLDGEQISPSTLQEFEQLIDAAVSK
ncbi:DsbA family protein [Arthrobacter sp. I2-34]|uniref:DsbA family protein n=1 Tax=Arthrobacter hankyongi TaxID=2904801 RepID=A0ABS9L4Z7_9MICC|nr:thioredoxin domain-containing protein [Arthrobacter hankyongi]MCG2621643.1 DsbA family protein [Arthrobacter hankyongi]